MALVVFGPCPGCASVGESMGALFIQPGRTTKHGCSDYIIICGFKNIYLSKGSLFLILTEVLHRQPRCFGLCVSPTVQRSPHQM